MTPEEIAAVTLPEAIAKDRRERKRTRILSAALVVGFLGLGFAFWLILTDEELTPCQTNAAGIECQQTKFESDLVRPIYSACVIPALTGLGCPALGIKPKDGEEFLRRLADGKRPIPDDRSPNAPDPSVSNGGELAPSPAGGGGGSGGDSDAGGLGADPPAAPTEPDPGGNGSGGQPDPEPATPQGTVGEALGNQVDQATGLICAVTDPLTGRCIR